MPTRGRRATRPHRFRPRSTHHPLTFLGARPRPGALASHRPQPNSLAGRPVSTTTSSVLTRASTFRLCSFLHSSDHTAAFLAAVRAGSNGYRALGNRFPSGTDAGRSKDRKNPNSSHRVPYRTTNARSTLASGVSILGLSVRSFPADRFFTRSPARPSRVDGDRSNGRITVDDSSDTKIRYDRTPNRYSP